MHDNEIFEELESMATNQREEDLTSVYITSERLRRWCTTTKEGKLISNMIMIKREQAIDAFTRCDVGDIEAMKNAKLDLEVSSRVFEMFNSIFQEGEIAEQQLKSGE